MSDINSSVYAGVVMHHRFRPKKHRFIYRVFSLCIDLDELPALDKQLMLFSVNRFNLFSFHEKDYGKGDDHLKKHITHLLNKYGYPKATAKIELLCYPRILNYVFNPLSVYFCYDDRQKLAVILYEVSNTFGKRHTYLLPVTNPQASWIRQSSKKRLYVSPFMPMETRYSFRIKPPKEEVGVCIRQSHYISEYEDTTDSTHVILNATFTGNKKPLSDSQLLRLFVSHPLMTLKVITAIHWEAIRLWIKGMRLQDRDKNEPSYSISWLDSNGVSQHEIL